MKKLALIVIGLILGVSGLGFWFGILNREETVSLEPKVGLSQEKQPLATASNSVKDLSTYQGCANLNKKISIKYPADWFSNQAGEMCHYFSPVATTLDKNSLVKLETMPNQKSLLDLENSLKMSNEEIIVLSKKTVEVGTNSATRIETQATGLGSSAKGSISVYYLIDNEVTPVVLSYSEISPEGNRSDYLKILDLMTASLKFN